MHRLAASDFSAMLRFVHQIQAAWDLDQFSTEVVRGLRGLIASDLVAYNHIDIPARRSCG